MKKRIFAILLIIAIFASVAGCNLMSENEATADEGMTSVAETTTVPATTETKVNETTEPTTVPSTTTVPATTTVAKETEAVKNDVGNSNNNTPSNESNDTYEEDYYEDNNESVDTPVVNDKPANNNKGPVTKIVFDNDYIVMDVGDVVEVGFTMDGVAAELHCNLGQPNQIKTKVLFDTKQIRVTACRAGEATFTLSTDNGTEATCTVYVNYPSVDNITGDTVLSYDQINTEKVSQMICDDMSEYFLSLGMTYEPEFDKDNSGWFFAHHCSAFGTTGYTYDELIGRITESLMGNIDAVLLGMYEGKYTDYKFNMTYFMEGDSYVVIFCYG